MNYLLDTNICIYLIKNKPESVLKELEKHDPSQIFISSITYAELMHGVYKSRDKEKNQLAIAMLLANIEVVPFDEYAASEYGEIRADLEVKGTPIGIMDMLIAGHCKALGFTLVTNNEKEFKRVKELDIENWVKEN